MDRAFFNTITSDVNKCPSFLHVAGNYGDVKSNRGGVVVGGSFPELAFAVRTPA